MAEPPSMWLILPVAAVCLWQSARLSRLRQVTKGLVGGKVEYVMYLSFLPAAVAMLNAETLPSLRGPIAWSREHFLVLLVTGVTLTEASFRITQLVGTYRLALIAETSERAGELDTACHALEAINCCELAIAGYRRLESRTSEASRVQSAMAALLGISRRFLEAERYARRAVESDASNPLAHAYLSLALLEQGRTDEAQSSRAAAERLGFEFDSFTTRRLRSSHPS